MQKGLRFASDLRAVTSLEYAVIGGMIVLAIVGAVSAIGHNLQTAFQTIANGI